MEHNGASFVCRAICLLGSADLPGKSAVQGFVQFNGKSGCSFCEDEGEVIAAGKGHVRCYPFIAGPPKILRQKEMVVQHGKNAQQYGLPVSKLIWIKCFIVATIYISNKKKVILVNVYLMYVYVK